MGQSALFQNCKEAEVGALREALKLAHADIAGLRADAQRSQRASSELHHRLNNSFQLLCGSLRLQERSLRGGEAADAIAAARHRIAAVGRVHAFLLKGDKVGTLNLGQYVTDLCEAIAASLDCPCDVEAEDCEVGLGVATSVGTIVNELLINAAKHARPNGPHDAGLRVQRRGTLKASWSRLLRTAVQACLEILTSLSQHLWGCGS